MIDLHCHILPGMDDGPGDAGESLEMAELAARDGIRSIVATPHSNNGVYRNDLDSIVLFCSRLNDLARSRALALNILPGAEIRIHQGMERLVRQGEIASLNNTRQYLLVEFPHDVVLPGTRQVLYQLIARDITPVLAHPERNEAIQRNPDLLADLVNMGCLVQLTAMSITGELGQAAMVCSHLLLQKRQAHVIASDAHDTANRPPLLSFAVAEAARLLGDRATAEAMVTNNPQAIIDGRRLSLHDQAIKPVKRGWRQKWFGRRSGKAL